MPWRHRIEATVTRAWYEGAWWLWLFWPLSLLTALAVGWRRYRIKPAPLSVPVVVVGGITVGGTGTVTYTLLTLPKSDLV